MADYAKLIILGRVTRDPEQRFTPSNTAVTEFGMATTERFTSNGEKRETPCFYDMVAWGKQAETLTQYVRKGDLLFCECRPKLDVWEDKQGGGKRSKMRFTVESFQLMPKRDGGKQDQGDDSNPFK